MGIYLTPMFTVLEGRAAGSCYRDVAVQAAPLVSDGVVLRLLQNS